MQRRILSSNRELKAISELYETSRRSASARNLFSTSLLPRTTVALYFIALRRWSKLAGFRRNNRKLRSVIKGLKTTISFNVNYKRKRQGV